MHLYALRLSFLQGVADVFFKRRLIVFPLLFLCFSVLLIQTSCQNKENYYHIGVSQCSDDEWRTKMNTEMMHEAALQQNIKLEIKTVEDDTEQQIKDIQYFIEQQVDLIIVAPNKAAPITPIVEEAYGLGIPIILVDRKILSDQFTAFIGADNYQVGKEVGHYVAGLLNGKGNIVEIRGLEGSSPALERHQGFYSVIHQYPEINLVFDGDGAWLKEVASNKMEEAMNVCPEIDLVFAQNDRMAIGAYNAAKQQKRESSMRFLGIDALPGPGGGIEEVLNGRLQATFIYPTGGDRIIQLALNILEEKPYEKYTNLNTAVIDSTNVIVFKLQADEILAQESKIRFLNERVDIYLSQYTIQRYLLLSAVAIVLIFVVFSFFLVRAYRLKHRLNEELEKRNQEIGKQKDLLEQQRDQLILLSRQLEEATHAKLVFFTNISHEFRTPLTLISGPVSSLLTDKTLSQEQYRLLKLADKNVNVLMKLIDQIIDFRKYENGKLELIPGEYDLRKELLEWNTSFVEICRKKNINFEFHADESLNYQIQIDLEKIERIYFNLLSNAIKFTNEKGLIAVELKKISEEDTDYACIEVSNTGKGISEKDIQHIFSRFYQVESHMAGSGIGLALAKALVELHDGSIEVESIKGEKTIFTVRIPFLKRSIIDSLQQPELTESKIQNLENNLFLSRREVFDDEAQKDRHSLLVIDDNPDILSYIKTVFEEKYHVLLANDGEEGFKKAVKTVPDLIISDVMMPKMDGLELCNKLKEELSTNHIPVILLTAWSMDEQRILGFQSGADDYISKPFNSQVLEVRVNNLIENRKKLKAIFQQNLFSGEETQDTFSEPDKLFLDKFRQLIEKNIGNSELNVEELGQNMGLSRTQLYRKIKSLTNYSPNELVRILRLKKSYQLISSSEMTIAEICYEVGFTSPSYFSKCFKEYYNELPADLIKRMRN